MVSITSFCVVLYKFGCKRCLNVDTAKSGYPGKFAYRDIMLSFLHWGITHERFKEYNQIV